ncbi:hypothetical protein MCOR25_006933 [Pyricularia grisea]|nr:hypothetical protein MCOR25_006933 [Pyricularia grisea]
MTTPDRQNTFNEKVMDPDRLAPDQATLHEDESREYTSRLTDDLELLRAERLVTTHEQESHSRTSRDHRRRAPSPIPEDAFNEQVDEKEQHTGPAPNQEPPTLANKAWIKIKKFPRVIRYLVYWMPVAAILMAPILVDKLALDNQQPLVGGNGGVQLYWFGIWLQILWGTLWASRFICAIMPYLFKWCAKMVGSNNHKKWLDVGRGLELHTALFVWMLSVLVSYWPTLNMGRLDDKPDVAWIDVVFKVIIALFVLAALNFIVKILIQWIANSFHRRTYAYRIEANKRDIQYLVSLYTYSRTMIEQEEEWSPNGQSPTAGARTPMQALQRNARDAFTRVGNVANRVAGDFTGRKILGENHPQKVVAELLRSTPTSFTLGRLIFRTFVTPGNETLTLEDFQKVFDNSEDAEACLSVFDKDLNGDVSMQELELVCNEIHLEKKAIAASLKDLDSVIKKLDKVFMFIVLVIAVIVFVSIISGSAAAALGSAGTTILGLAWMLQATAQEFLQSIIFVFVKHPFDVGDRVRVYGNTGDMMTGDDYYVQEISLLYTEFKKMQGHVVQAPNSLLNNLFILNQRRSNGLADPIVLKVRFGTTNEVIEELRDRMTDFVLENKRDYGPRIITEVSTIDEVYSVTLSFVFFHKSSFQNELLRLQRHNRFAGELMRQMALLGIEGPRKQQPGGTKDLPFYWTSVPPPAFEPATTYVTPRPEQPQSQPSQDGTSTSPVVPFPSLSIHASDQERQQQLREQHQQSQQQQQQQSSTAVASGANSSTTSVRRRRGPSVVIDHGPDMFQDVYGSRRHDTSAQLARLQSIRAAEHTIQPPTHSPSSPGIERTATLGSLHSLGQHPSRRFWSRRETIQERDGGEGEERPIVGSPTPPPPGASATKLSNAERMV